MTQPATLGVVKETSLKDLNIMISQYESILGPLISLGNDGTQTITIFDTDQATPAQYAVVAADQAGQSQIPAGSSMVCQGTIFIQAALVHVSASRPKAAAPAG